MACQIDGSHVRNAMQIMPQLINHLGVDASDPAAPDWGMIAVYSCPDSCAAMQQAHTAATADVGRSAYVEEFVWVQPST